MKRGKFRYKVLADQLQSQIETGGFTLSEKLPSLRVLCQQTGFSMTTVFQAYVELEKRGVIVSRQRSGYFIRPRSERLRMAPDMTCTDMVPQKINLDDMIHQLTEDLGNPSLLKLGAISVAPAHLPVEQLHRHLKAIPKTRIPQLIAGYVHPLGDPGLRRQILRLIFAYLPEITEADILLTNGCTEALSLGIRAVTSPGDTILVESPADPWLRQAIRDLKLYALEVPTHPETGMDLHSVEQLLARETVAACIVNPNCQNPLGFIMPDDHKKTLVDLMEKNSIPIIENDVSGDLHFGEIRPRPLKSLDTKGTVIYCSSFSKTLAPGLRVGWMIPGRFKDKIQRMKLNASLVSPALNQALIAAYLKEGRFPRHLRRLRTVLRVQYQYCAAAINACFPKTVKMTRPAGGQSLWIELPPHTDGRQIYKQVRSKGISVLPGFLCTSFSAFDNFIRIGYGGVWDEETKKAIKVIAAAIRQPDL